MMYTGAGGGRVTRESKIRGTSERYRVFKSIVRSVVYIKYLNGQVIGELCSITLKQKKNMKQTKKIHMKKMSYRGWKFNPPPLPV